MTQHIAQFYGVKVSHVTLIKWIRKFSELIDDYANTLRLQLSGVWNCDEMKTKMAHEEPITVNASFGCGTHLTTEAGTYSQAI